MKLQNEAQLYEPVRLWFETRLKRRFRRSVVQAYDTSCVKLSAFINAHGWQSQFPEAGAWEIKTDITAFILGRENHVAFVECKVGRITLKDVGQLLGYSRVARPVLSILLSPLGLSSELSVLLKVYGRYDVLGYGGNDKTIMIVQWDTARAGDVPAKCLPPGLHI